MACATGRDCDERPGAAALMPLIELQGRFVRYISTRGEAPSLGFIDVTLRESDCRNAVALFDCEWGRLGDDLSDVFSEPIRSKIAA